MLSPLVNHSKLALRHPWQTLAVGIASALLTALPGQAAERILFNYGPLEFTLPVSSLEEYVATGKVDRNLAFYFQFLSPDVKDQVRKSLTSSTRDLKPFAVSQALYSSTGEAALHSLGKLIQAEGPQNGFYALRAAVILAAADPKGLTPIGFLKAFPTRELRLNTALAFEIESRFSTLAKETNEVIDLIGRLAQAEAAQEPPLQLNKLPSIESPGPISYTKQSLRLRDAQRDRPVPTDFYIPDLRQTAGSIPVVVISHGLGEDRTTYESLAQTLASHGFLVAYPEHIGSNGQIQQDLLGGLSKELFLTGEFTDRPLDASFVLNILEQRNQAEFGGRLNLQNVGVMGLSFGGYTALTIAGATVDFPQVQSICAKTSVLESLNISLLLQCRATILPKDAPQAAEMLAQGKLRDPRVKAIVAAHSVNSIILGRKGLQQIQVPTLMVAGGYDPVTPLIEEQLQAFHHLTTTDKYLLLADRGSHTAELGVLFDRLFLTSLPPAAVEQEAAEARKNRERVVLAFAQVYVAGRSEYRPYLQSNYANSLNTPSFNLRMIRTLSPELLAKIYKK